MNLDSGPGQMLQRSCDRCHRSKHKCVFSNQQASCVRCLRLGKHCTTRRPRARLGRPATAPDFPSGQAGIFTSLGTSGIDVAQDQSDCLTETGPARSPASSSSHVDVEAGRASAISLSMPHTTFVSLGELYLGDADDFSATHGYFMIGPTFITPFYSVVRWLVTSPSNTEHIGGYLAFLSLIRRLQVAHPSVSTVELMAGANGLRSLQNLGLIRQRNSGLEAHLATSILGLGSAMAVFETLTTCHSAHTIMKSALLSIRPYYDLLLQNPSLDPVTITPVLSDTIECLVRRTVPIIRFPSLLRVVVDRYVGVCCTLLPLLYDLCECSSLARESRQDGKDPYEDVERMIHAWEPIFPVDFLDTYTQEESTAMVTQAKVYRLAALLVVHRLRFPLGREDEEAQDMAKEIIGHLLYYALSDTSSCRVMPMMFPLLVAMLEVEGPGEKVIDHISKVNVQVLHTTQLLRFIAFVRYRREQGFRGLWFELAEGYDGCFVI